MLLSCHNLTVSYQGYPALHKLSCAVQLNTITAVVGPNGAGKSTFFKALLGLVSIEAGFIKFHNNITNKDIAYLPQINQINDFVPLTVIDAVTIGALTNNSHGVTEKKIAQAHSLITKVGLTGLADTYISELSTGQLQRVLFAKMMLQDSRVLLLDEPFNHVDAKTIDDLSQLLIDLCASGYTILLILHDLMQVRAIANHAILIASNLIASGEVEQVLTTENLHLAYNNNYIRTHDRCREC